jgi:transcriptional regulator with PAS, ATPase and Fis domain
MQTVVANDLALSGFQTSTFNNQVKLDQANTDNFYGLIAQCPSMQRVIATIKKIARTDCTALILGETGTGKELVARAIHNLSGRKGNMVPVNCGAIPEDILESELFGHERGAFTGAISSRIGRFQMADGGTIFLDEIGEMSPKLQVKLLRVLQEKTVEPVGSTKSIKVDVRIIAATNKDLKEEVKAGRFREDLYYRLQVIPINLPALRDRGSDLELLVQHFFKKTANNLKLDSFTISPEALQALKAYSWPGNIRELENVIERIGVLSESDQISFSDLPDHIIGAGANSLEILDIPYEIPQTGLDFNSLVEQFENKLITMALSKTSGNKKAAAELLNLNRTTLVEKIKKKGINLSDSTDLNNSHDPLFE